MPSLRCWITPVGSPGSNYQTVADVVAAARSVAAPGLETRVLLPTFYDDYPQQQCNRTLGDELAIDSAEDAAVVRARIEAEGFGCDGWSVPRATGDVALEGYLHGQVAAKFDYFVLNFEEGWSGFWTAEGASVVDLWITAFWQAIEDAGRTAALNGNVWVTMVTNTGMMQALSDAELRAWTSGTNGDALEAYIPGDVGLDPGNALAIWRQRLDANGITGRPVVVILEQGDLPSLVAQYADPVHGIHVWTLAAAAAATWPRPDRHVAVMLQTADALTAEATRPAGPRRTVIRTLASQLRLAAQE